MAERKIRLVGPMGTKFRIIMDGPYAGDLVELWRVLRDSANTLKKIIEPKLKELEKEGASVFTTPVTGLEDLE